MIREHSVLPVGTRVVIFTLCEKRLYLLLVDRANNSKQSRWALPGGPLQAGEDIDQCARRKLDEETGVSGVYLEQLYTYSGKAPDAKQRGITVAYYALFPLDTLQAQRPTHDAGVGWFPLNRLPHLHHQYLDIVTMAHTRLAAKLEYSTIALQFLPAQFTLRELQEVYEIILQQPLDKRNFRKSVLAQDYIEATGKTCRTGSHRPAKLYRVKSPGKVEFMKSSVTRKVIAEQLSSSTASGQV